jgi:CTP:molybdopterin cytidylyltransferase MocA
MGQPKLLRPLGDKPVIRHCIDTLVAADVRDIVAVVSISGNGIREILSGLPATIAVNNIPGSDMAESVRTGLRALKGSPSGVLACLSDHPLVSPETIRSIIRQHRKTPGVILIPVYQGKRGHPTLFPINIISDLFTGPYITLRDIIQKNAPLVRAIDVDDEGVVLDMDTEEDYHKILHKFDEK